MKRKFCLAKEELENLYINKKLSPYQIAFMVGVSRETIRNKLKKYSIPIRSKDEANRRTNILKKQLENLYYKQKLSIPQIANICHVGQTTIYYWLKKYNIPTRSCVEGICLRIKICISKNQLKDLYLNKRLSIARIAKLLNVDYRVILRRLKEYNIPKKETFKDKHKKLEKLSNTIIEMYIEKDLTAKEIAEALGFEKTSIANLLRKKGFLKTSKEKLKGKYIGNKASNWQGGVTPKNTIERHRSDQREWGKKVFERDNYTCQICGRKGCYLEAHHILNFSSNPKIRKCLNNGITLCKKCHRDFHNKYGYKNNTLEQLQEFSINYKLKEKK